MKFRNCTRLEIKGENFRQFRDSEWARSHGDADEESSGRFALCLFDLSQSALVCLIKGRQQFVQNILSIPWESVGEVCELTLYPSKPIGFTGKMDKSDEV